MQICVSNFLLIQAPWAWWDHPQSSELQAQIVYNKF